jgi:hypothetical protein
MELGNTMPKNFFAVSGKMGSGKDTLTSCIQIMTSNDSEIVEDFYDNPETTLRSYTGIIENLSRFKNVKFADDVKHIVAKLLGVTVRKLEDRTFKETELGEEWWFYRVDGEMIPYTDTKDYGKEDKDKIAQYLVKLTPRRLFQLIATEGGRNIIHPNIWVNSLFARYVKNEEGILPEWIVSDMRFVNEFNACVRKGAVTIRVVRHQKLSKWLDDYAIDLPDLVALGDTKMSDSEFLSFLIDVDSDELKDIVNKLSHESETSLDEIEHDYVIHNDGSIAELVNKLRDILLNEGVELTATAVDNLKLNGGL